MMLSVKEKQPPDVPGTPRDPERSSLTKGDGVWVHAGEPDGSIDWERVIDEVREDRHRQVLGPALSVPNDEPGIPLPAPPLASRE
jgi:hypothetical protein